MSSPTISVSVDLLERAIQALDTTLIPMDTLGYAEDAAQVRASYDELVALVAEHSDMEDDEDG